MDSLKSIKAELSAANKDILDLIGSFTDELSFVQTDALTCSENDFGSAPGEGVVSGFASVDGTHVCVFATNPAVFKGAIGALNAKKIVRTINNAIRTRNPLIAVWDTSGARVTEGIDCLEGYGDILRAYTDAYGRVPVISVIKGKNLGMSSYISGLSDFVIACPDSVTASASPLVISAKAGVPEKTVGSAKQLLESGIVSCVVKPSELKATISKLFKLCYGEAASDDDPNRISKALKAGAPVDTVISEVVDKGSFFALRDGFAPVVVTGLATLAGVTVGVVATDSSKNDGKLSADACIKIRELLNVCESADCPVVFITDCTGTEISGDDARLIREMSDLIYAINTFDGHKFALVTGRAIGAAYSVLVSPCDFKIAWENAEVSALESEAAARLIYSDEIKSAKNKDKAAAKLAESYAMENCAASVIARSGHFDNVIEPDKTRPHLIAALLAHVE